MASGQLRTVISKLRLLMGGDKGCALSDSQLLDDFVNRRDERSFEVLVWRHGTMVLGLCQRVLHDSHAAEDAFQATFLVFARKAGAISKREALGSWLYKTAYRVALRLRAKAAQRSAREEPANDLPAREAADDVLWRDLRPVLDEEINRLPEKYRVPLVLCYLEGHTNKEAAQHLGCPEGTVLSRLARGRERLRARLTRRGLALSAAGLALALSQNASSAAVPPSLVSSTLGAAIPFAAGQAAAPASAAVVLLAEGVLRTMFITNLKALTAATLSLVLLGTGVGAMVHAALARTTATHEVAAPRDEEETAFLVGRDNTRSGDISGKVVAVAIDGKSFTLETPAPDRGGDAKEAMKFDFKIDDETAVNYYNVGPDGARPAIDYVAQVRPRDGAKDVIASVIFRGPEHLGRGRRPDLAGRVSAVPGTGQITLEVPSAKPREQEPKKVTVTCNDKSLILYFHVGKGGAVLREGYEAQVWLEEPEGATVATVHLAGTEAVEERGGPEPDVSGKVVAVAKDGKTITLDIAEPLRGRAEKPSEPKRIDVKISDRTAVAYNNVGPDETQIAEGITARVWLEPGSKDSAAKASFAGTSRERGTLVAGKVVGVAENGLAFTVELPARARGEEAKTVEVKISPKTRIVYFGVGPDGAKMTEGYVAQARLVDGPNQHAAEVMFSKPGSGRGR
jgi:RNA polymerase sigma factor (sigma-70 family)